MNSCFAAYDVNQLLRPEPFLPAILPALTVRFPRCINHYFCVMPKWYFRLGILACTVFSCTAKKQPEDLSAWKIKGDSVVTRSFDTLRNTLLRTIGEKGFAGAVGFCNEQAIPLTNTYSTEGVSIKRTSDRLRNPANAPDSMEARILSQLSSLKRKNLPLIDFVVPDDNGYHYFKPIVIQALCLNCHGARSAQIKPGTWDAIIQKYPADSAFNYKESDLRGIWHITLALPKK